MGSPQTSPQILPQRPRPAPPAAFASFAGHQRRSRRPRPGHVTRLVAPGPKKDGLQLHMLHGAGLFAYITG